VVVSVIVIVVVDVSVAVAVAVLVVVAVTVAVWLLQPARTGTAAMQKATKTSSNYSFFTYLPQLVLDFLSLSLLTFPCFPSIVFIFCHLVLINRHRYGLCCRMKSSTS
jgi:hypothetical protein